MIKGIGIDAVELSRIKKIIEEKPTFVSRVLTPNELNQFNLLSTHRKVEFLGGRFACKEAFSKAWGTGIGQLTFQDVEILSNKAGAPMITKAPIETDKVFVSITHTQTMAFAQIIIEE